MEVQDLVNKIPASDQLEKRFDFIKNDILRSNIAIAFQYVSFLVSLDGKGKVRGPVIHSIYKNIILYTASIVESCVHYILKEYIDCGIIDSTDVMPFSWKYKNIKELYLVSEDEKIVGAMKYRSHEKMQSNTQFKSLNEAAKKAKLFDQSLFEKAEELRSKRNKIHLAGLEKVDDYYDKKTVDEVFGIATEIIEKIELKCEEINS